MTNVGLVKKCTISWKNNLLRIRHHKEVIILPFTLI